MISVDRAKTILECYGGHPQAWPDHERDELQQALAGSKSLQIYQQEALALDEFMGFSAHKVVTLDNQVCNQCAKQILDKLPKQEQLIVKTSRRNDNSKIQLGKQFFEYSQPLLWITSIMLIVIGLSSSLHYTDLEKSEILSLSDYMDLYDDQSYIGHNITSNTDELEILAFLEPNIQEEYN